MALSDLIEFVEALNHQRGKKLLPTTLTSAELRDLFAWEKRQSVFSAQMDLLEHVQAIKDVTEAVINPTTQTREDGSQFTSGMDQATARLKLKESLERLGYQPAEDERGTIKDQSSFARRSLVVKTNVELAQGVGHFQQSNQANVVDAYPCWELVRFEDRKEPRNWPQRWMIAAQTVGDVDAVKALPRMIARKDSPIWQELGDAEDGLGNPYPPFAFNSGMWVQDVPRQECIEFGIIDAESEVTPQELELPGAEIPASLDQAFRELLPFTNRRANVATGIVDQLLGFVDAFKNYNPNHDSLGQFTGGASLSVTQNIKRGTKAVRRALTQKRDVPNAMKRKELGTIHLVWGTPGETRNDFKGGYGLSHVVAKHGREAALMVPRVIAKGSFVRHADPLKRELHYKGNVVVVTKEKNKTSWVLTSFKPKTK